MPRVLDFLDFMSLQWGGHQTLDPGDFLDLRGYEEGDDFSVFPPLRVQKLPLAEFK